MNLEQIDTSTTAGKARVMQLAAGGRKVVERGAWAGASWITVDPASWNWEHFDYAVVCADLAEEVP